MGEKEGQFVTGKDVAKNSSEMPSAFDSSPVTIAVVGGDKVGKSTFIRRALEMRSVPSSRATTKKMAMDNSVYTVRLLEIHSKDVESGNQGVIVWPSLAGDQDSTTVHGAVVLHDFTQPAVLSETSRLLDALAVSTLPHLSVASKCDIDSRTGESNTIIGSHEIVRTSQNSSQSPKTCIAFVLHSIIANRQAGISGVRSPGNSAVSRSGHHARANSEAPQTAFNRATGGETATFNRKVDGNGESRNPNDPSNSSNLAPSLEQIPRYDRSNSNASRPQTPLSRDGLNQDQQPPSEGASPDRDRNRQHRLHTAWRRSAGSDILSSFLDIEDDTNESKDPQASSNGNKDKSAGSASGENNDKGLTFDELVDRLVAQPMSKQESKFVSVFLCLYRKFAAPATLLNALISRFENNEKESLDQLTLVAAQVRLLNVLAQWTSEYPGDFAYPKTRQRIADFVAVLEKNPFYMFAAKEIGSYVETTVDDDDVGWPFRDGDNQVAEDLPSPESFLDNSTCSTPSAFLSGILMHGGNTGEEAVDDEEDPLYSLKASELSEGSPEAPKASSAGPSNTTLHQSLTSLSLESSQKGVQQLDLRPKFSLTKVQWRQFMDIPDEDFARELTRIDWVMYNSFGPRDLVRHVGMSGPEREKVKSLHNVSRMIKQFNHLASFVASMILLRDKPKHRARALERFMSIAQKLRRQNNYNSLGAVIAGVNGTPVHRLTQTKELIPPLVQKDFMRLVILMSTQKSHFAYRLAWENSPSERIPFLPLHRRDLVSAEEGNKTFLDENKTRINWNKFEVMGEVVLGIQRSQKTLYPHMNKCEDALQLILETQLSGNEEDLYARSLQVEPAAGGDTTRRKFGNWISRNVLPI